MVKLFAYNRLGDCLATNRLTDYPEELFAALGFENKPSERSLYRMIERVGKNHAFVLEEHQKVLAEYNLVTPEQFFDFSSSYFEGKAEAIGELGYSRGNLPGKKQIVFGISTRINDIPTALAIQKGNMQDKEFILRKEFHYLTLKPKKGETCRKHVRSFSKEKHLHLNISERDYFCVKKKQGEEFLYIFFSPPAARGPAE